MTPQYVSLLLAVSVCSACAESDPSTAVDAGFDAGPDAASDSGDADGWASWPPRPGRAGLRLFWTIEGQIPTQESCAAVDLDRVELALLHPVVDFEIWSPPRLHAQCENGAIALAPDNGLEPGRYRYRAALFHGNGQGFAQQPVGEMKLVENQITIVAGISITQADQ